MNLSTLDKSLATEVMNYEVINKSYERYYDGKDYCGFKPTTNIEDAFKLIYKLQGELAWGMNMTNLENEVEVQIGTGYYSDKSIPLAISIATLKHFKMLGFK